MHRCTRLIERPVPRLHLAADAGAPGSPSPSVPVHWSDQIHHQNQMGGGRLDAGRVVPAFMRSTKLSGGKELQALRSAVRCRAVGLHSCTVSREGTAVTSVTVRERVPWIRRPPIASNLRPQFPGPLALAVRKKQYRYSRFIQDEDPTRDGRPDRSLRRTRAGRCPHA